MMENFNFENTWMVFSYSLITIFILLVIFTLFYLRKIKYEKKNLESLLSTSNAQRSEFEKKFKITRDKLLETYNTKTENIRNDILNQRLQKVSSFNKVEYMRWEDFRLDFKFRHPFYFDKILTAHPRLTSIDLKYCSCFYCEFTNQQTSILLAVTQDAVKKAKQKLKKKFNLESVHELSNFLHSIDHLTIQFLD